MPKKKKGERDSVTSGSARERERADLKGAESGKGQNAISKIASTKVSRRTVLRGTAAAAAAVGVAAVAIEGLQAEAQTGQTSSGSIEQLPSVSTSTTQVAANPFASQSVTFTVNGVSQTVVVEPRDTLALVLREDLDLIGTKMACNRMMCGACTVLVNGVPIDSCQYLAFWANGKTILTTEAGLPPPSSSSDSSSTAPVDPVVAALQSAWAQEDGGQCCFCSPGQIMAATALLKQNPNPSVSDIQTSNLGNLCRCGNYPNIIASIQAAAAALGGA